MAQKGTILVGTVGQGERRDVLGGAQARPVVVDRGEHLAVHRFQLVERLGGKLVLGPEPFFQMLELAA